MIPGSRGGQEGLTGSLSQPPALTRLAGGRSPARVNGVIRVGEEAPVGASLVGARGRRAPKNQRARYEAGTDPVGAFRSVAIAEEVDPF